MAIENGWFYENLHPTHNQCLKMDEILFRDQTEHQDLIIFQNNKYGRVMTLDGVVQVTERDNGIYHEMLAWVPILAHGAAKDVLIIGGGDGGMLRHVLAVPSVERAVMVEIDRAVIDMALEHMPSISAGAFDDPRAEIVITDGAKFVQETERRFDVVIVDSTDPIGPGAVLFTEEFYGGCRRCLNDPGILVTQNGVAWHQGSEVTDTWQRFAPHFADRWFYTATIPTYMGGPMAFGWGATRPGLRDVPVATLAERAAQIQGITPLYYTPAVHAAAFALPRYVTDLLVEA